MTLLKAEPCVKLMHSAVRTAIIAPLAGYQQRVCVCVCFSSKVSSLTPFVSGGGLCVCARVFAPDLCVCQFIHSIYLLCACLCFYVTLHIPTHLSFFICSTAVLLYCSCQTIYYLPSHILEQRGGVANRRTILHMKCCECDSGPFQVPCCRTALESSGKAVNPSQPRGCFCFSNSVLWGGGVENQSASWGINKLPSVKTLKYSCTHFSISSVSMSESVKIQTPWDKSSL